MKKLICILLCVAMALSTLVLFSSCDNGSGGKLDGATQAQYIEAEKAYTFQVMRSGVDRSNTDYPAVQAVIEFEETYGREIEWITCGYDEWTQKVMASIASGKPIAVVNGSEYEFPLYAMKKYAQPIDDYVDMESEYFSETMAKLFEYKGKHYVASAGGSGQPLVIYYNKNMFENEGVEDPMELYNRKEWTFDKFREVAMKFTRDTDGDGKYDQWGLCAWYQWVFFGGAAASVCKINEEGLFELNMDNNPALVEALEFIQDGWYTSKWVGLEGSDIYTSFYQQKNAMINEFTWAGDNILKAKAEGQFAFDVGCVGFPYGKNNPDRVNYCFLDGFSILNGCETPYSAGKLIDIILEKTVADGESKQGETPQEWLDLYADLTSRPFNSSMPDNAIDGGKTLCTKVGHGMDIQQALETYRPVYQGLVDEANQIPEDKIERDFTTIDLDFTGGSTEGLTQASTDQYTSLSVTNPGDHLFVALDVFEVNGSAAVLKTDPEKNPIWGYKSYKITFEYKVDEIPLEYSVFKFEIKRDNINGSMGVFKPDYAAVGNWAQGEVVVSGVADNSALQLIISSEYMGNLYLKNLKIEEVKD